MPTTEAEFTLEPADWAGHGPLLYAVRHAVFVQEQGVPEELEQDAFDPVCRHVLARDRQGDPIGVGRLSPDGRLGRLAVLRPWRGRGVGAALTRWLVEQARRQGLAEVTLHAQLQALDFYAALGFQAVGEPFIEAGIPHRLMLLPLSPHRESSP